MADKSSIMQIIAGNIFAAAQNFREMAGPTADTILIGPALNYSGMVSSVIITGAPGLVGSLDFGKYMPDVSDDALARAFDNVLTIRSSDEITISEATLVLGQFVAEVRPLFKSVQTFTCDKELAQAYAEQFPSDEASKLVADVMA